MTTPRKSPSRTVEADPVAVAGWLEVDRLAARVRDLERRAERTLDYAEQLLELDDLDSMLRVVLQAVKGSLTTPYREPQNGHYRADGS